MGRRSRKSNRDGGDPEAHRGFRRLRLPLALVAVVLAAAAVAAALLLAWPGSDGGPSPKRAAIIDQLSLTQPNPDFAEQATGLLQRAGYAVDYYPGEQVTVDFYRDLPARDYDLIILRTHSALATEQDPATGQTTDKDYVGLFTSEPYDAAKHSGEEEQGLLGPGHYYQGGQEWFVVGPKFIERSMRGRFDKTLVIMMGCDGLKSPLTAQNFLAKGASAFVSWSKPVSASHTDAATLRLLEKLLVGAVPIADAVAQTAAEVGPDPTYGAELRILTGG